MKLEQAIHLIQPGVSDQTSIWADLGAGSGIFTLALNEILGFGGVVFAVDQRLDILRNQLKIQYSRATIHLYEENFTNPMPFLPPLDGILMANTLHYVRDQESFLSNLRDSHLKPGGTLLVVEYDHDMADQWVPYPLPLPYFERLASKIGLSLPEEIGRQKSIYGNQDLYAAYCHKGSL
ncbi:MAG: class I SAM-dependent methyltransferase [Saprospiraceae bacterium]|nr:class I SAM-dependent methyltransferase [Saprospiraceae bacterium]